MIVVLAFVALLILTVHSFGAPRRRREEARRQAAIVAFGILIAAEEFAQRRDEIEHGE
jgi:hypothetical protein